MRKLIAALLVAAVLFGVGAVAVNAQGTWQVFENVRVRGLQVLGDATVGDDLTVTDDLTVGGDISGALTPTTINASGNGNVDGHLVVGNYLALQNKLYMIPPAAITVLSGGTITPTGAVVELSAAGTVGAELAPAGDGEFLVLINTVNQTITISETASARMAGDFAMGQYDTLTLVGQGVTWHEVARSNN